MLVYPPTFDRADRVHAHHRLDGARPAVKDALAELAPAFQLQRADECVWALVAVDTTVRGTVTVLADGATSSLVELRLTLLPAQRPRERAVALLRDAWPLWILVVLLACAYLGLAGLVYTLLVPALLALPVVPLLFVLDALRMHRARRWLARWREALLPAIADRMRAHEPYR